MSQAKRRTTGRPKGGALSDAEKGATWETFIAAVANGETTIKAAKRAGVAWGSLCRWIDADETKARELQRAREAGAALWADRAVEAAEAATPQTAHVARLKFEARKWRAAVQAPRQWSERQSADVSVQVLSVAQLHLQALQAFESQATDRAPLSNPAPNRLPLPRD